MKVDPSTLPYRPCVGITLINDEGKIFIARRVDIKPDAWQMPQGGIDKGEDPRDACFRELAEETGITDCEILAETPDWLTYDLPSAILGKAMRGRYRGQKQKWFLARFTGNERDIDLAADTIEFDSWRWAQGSEVLDLIVAFKKPVYKSVLKQFEDWIKH